MKLCIAEKPSVAREIARILGANQQRKGYLEGNGYWVTWTFGHLCELEEPGHYNPAWKHWNLQYLPMIPDRYETRIIQETGIQEQFQVIQTLLSRCTSLINCGDAGQEGELIQRWVFKQAGFTGPHQRLWVSALTDQAIRQGFQNLRPSSEFENLFRAGLVRAIGDWVLGINATRAYSLKFGDGQNVLSVGRVQTPTLAMVVQRHHEILNFRPEPYWKVYALYREVKFFSIKNPFKARNMAEALFQNLEGHPLVIEGSKEKRQNTAPFRPFDLTSLQIECNKRFHFSAERTLKIAQSLYEKKVISYPRVDTQYLSDELFGTLPNLFSHLGNIREYAKFTQQIAQPVKKSARYFNNNKVTDHHAIIPTDQPLPRLTPDEARVYDLVTRRFLAIFFPDAIESKTEVAGIVNDQRLIARGKTLIDPGWQEVYPIKASKPKAEEDPEQIMPLFIAGESGPCTPNIEEKQTQPPKKYTEATLLRAMETCGRMVEESELQEALKANGIGRPSTRAAIIETLFRREYIRRENKNLIPTDRGIDLIAAIENPTLKSPALTGAWENKLRKIEAGEYKGGAFLRELNDYVATIIAGVQRASRKSVASSTPTPERVLIGLAICPKCKEGQVIEGEKAYGCSEWRRGCDFKIWKTICHKKISTAQAKTLIKSGKTAVLKGFRSKAGKSFAASLAFDSEFAVQLCFENPVN